MTKEEIREKYLYENGLSVNKGPVGERIQKATYAAMDEYSKERAIAFAKFVDAQGYTQTRNLKWESLSDLSGKTSDELYQLFEQSTKDK